jgi:hypothetical protein
MAFFAKHDVDALLGEKPSRRYTNNSATDDDDVCR